MHLSIRNTKPRLRATLLALTVGVALTITACTSASASDALSKKSAARLVPDSAQAFATVSIAPSKEQQGELYKLSQKLPSEVRAENGEKVKTKMIDQLLKDQGLTYDNDLKPWIGNEAAMALLKPYDTEKAPLAVAMIKTKDEAKTRDTLKKKNVDEKQFRFIDGYVVIIDKSDIEKRQGEKAFADLEAVKGGKPSLTSNEHYKTTLKALHGESLAIAWLDINGLMNTSDIENQTLKSLTESGQLESLDASAQKKSFQQLRDMSSVGMVMFATEDAAVAQMVSEKIPAGFDKTIDSRWIADLPADTTGAFDLPEIGETRDTLKSLLKSEGIDAQLPEAMTLLDKMTGEGAIAVGKVPAKGVPEIGAMFGTNDAPGAKAEMAKLVEKAKTAGLEQQGFAIMSIPLDGGEGYEITVPGNDIKPVVGVLNDRIVIATSKQYAETVVKKASSPLSATAGYAAALKDAGKRKNGGIYYVDLQKVLEISKAFENKLGGVTNEIEKSFDEIVPRTSTSTTLSKAEEEMRQHLQSAGIQGWIEKGHIYSEARITFK